MRPRSSLRPWTYTGDEVVADAVVFRLQRLRAISPRTGQERVFSRLTTGPWVNVVPLTPRREVVLVRQWRHGVGAFTLEIPGGLVDPGEDPAAAATREVREETGYAGDPPVEIGVVQPNPAILDNLTRTYLIENCVEVGALQLDGGEDIEVVLRPLHEVPRLIAEGAIRHALVICGFWWLAQQRPDLLPGVGAAG